MTSMFSECSSLSSLTDISKWNTNNVTNMSNIFYWCLSLSSLPDISKWNTNNVSDMRNMFEDCLNIIISEECKEKYEIKSILDPLSLYSLYVSESEDIN